MSITASGMFGLTLEKFFNAGATWPTNGMESETTVKVLLCEDGYTPNFDTHDFRNDVTNEVTGTGYSAGGVAITSTELTISTGSLIYDSADPSWTSSTIANAMAAVAYFARGGASSADELLFLADFITAVSTTNGTLLVQIAAGGWVALDYTP